MHQLASGLYFLSLLFNCSLLLQRGVFLSLKLLVLHLVACEVRPSYHHAHYRHLRHLCNFSFRFVFPHSCLIQSAMSHRRRLVKEIPRCFCFLLRQLERFQFHMPSSTYSLVPTTRWCHPRFVTTHTTTCSANFQTTSGFVFFALFFD